MPVRDASLQTQHNNCGLFIFYIYIYIFLSQPRDSPPAFCAAGALKRCRSGAGAASLLHSVSLLLRLPENSATERERCCGQEEEEEEEERCWCCSRHLTEHPPPPPPPVPPSFSCATHLRPLLDQILLRHLSIATFIYPKHRQALLCSQWDTAFNVPKGQKVHVLL